MSKLDRIALSLMCCAAFYALWLAAPRQSSGADGLVRYVQRDKETGEYEEGTRSVSVNEMTPDGIALEYESKGEKKSFNLPAEQIVWLQYADEPLELGAARVEIQVGNYEDALEKLGAIEEEIKEPAIQQEIEWNRAYAAIQSALADSGKLESGAAAMKTFVEAYPNHYRFYEGNALLADVAAALGRAPAAEKYYAVLAGAKSASYQARGKVGLANLALDAGELDKAKSLYSEVADMDELDGQLAGFDARAAALSGMRMPTVSSPPVVTYGTSSVRSQIIVTGPGQKASITFTITGVTIGVMSLSCSLFQICTMLGLSAGRPFTV